MFQQKLYSVLVNSFVGGLRCMSHSNRIPAGPTKNAFVQQKMEKLPHLPNMEFINYRGDDIDTHLSCQKVKYGDYEFMECKEGYILSYINAYLRTKQPQDGFYGVFYGLKNPLNISGPVIGPQTISHAKAYAILRAIETLPPDLGTKKVCICTDCTRTLKTLRILELYSENGYQSMKYGNVLLTKDTLEGLNKALRLRNDIQFRFLYTPHVVYTMGEPLKLATIASR